MNNDPKYSNIVQVSANAEIGEVRLEFMLETPIFKNIGKKDQSLEGSEITSQASIVMSKTVALKFAAALEKSLHGDASAAKGQSSTGPLQS